MTQLDNVWTPEQPLPMLPDFPSKLRNSTLLRGSFLCHSNHEGGLADKDPQRPATGRMVRGQETWSMSLGIE